MAHTMRLHKLAPHGEDRPAGRPAQALAGPISNSIFKNYIQASQALPILC